MMTSQNLRLLLISALILGIAADWLLFGHPPGVGVLLFCLLGLVLLQLNGRAHAIGPVRRNLWLVGALLFFAAMLFVRANPFLTLLNVTAVGCLLAFVAYFYAAGRVEAPGLVATAVLPLRVAFQSLGAPAPLVADLGREHGKRPVLQGNAGAIVRGSLLALPFLLVFTALLGAADQIFAAYVQRLLRLDLLPDLSALVRHVLVIGFSGWLLGGGILFALRQHGRVQEDDAFSRQIAGFPRRFALGFGETATILALVNLLFLAFCLIQAAYLFGGARNIGIEGFSYAAYARRGFFELVTTAVLALGLILGLNWLTRRETKRQLRRFNLLSSFTVALVLVMLVSAWRRMALYEAAFGATELRLIVFVAMAWLAVLLLWFGVTLWKRPHLFAIGCLVVAIGYVATLNLLNPDALIARRNLARYAATGDLDVVYLSRLSDDAVPLLTDALPALAGDTEAIADPTCWDAERSQSCETTRHAYLARDLEARFASRLHDTAWQRWPAYHVARTAAFAALEACFGGVE